MRMCHCRAACFVPHMLLKSRRTCHLGIGSGHKSDGQIYTFSSSPISPKRNACSVSVFNNGQPCSAAIAANSLSFWALRVGIVGRVGRRDALCGEFDPCRQRPRGVAVDFGPKQSDWLINQLGSPSLGVSPSTCWSALAQKHTFGLREVPWSFLYPCLVLYPCLECHEF